ncbi:MAG: sugar phosphate nucleotidyltransferase [bacterium]
MKIVIRAGGAGTRLWPMSRQNNPKQFQKIIGDQTMVRSTYERIKELLSSPNDLFISINKQLVDKLKQEIAEIKNENIIIETSTRNTGPAMCLEVCYLEKFCDSNEIVASLPSDDYISNPSAFRSLLQTSAEFLQTHPEYIITPAVRPSRLDTGYTYMKIGDKLSENGHEAIYQVSDIDEKPNEERCQELIDSGVYYCHAGMYIWQLGTISKLFQKIQPDMYKACSLAVGMMANQEWDKIKEIYGRLEKMSIESAITEKADKVAMSVSDKVGWSDLGKWHIIKRILSKPKENLTKGKVLVNQAKNNLIINTNDKKIIVINEIDDLVIIDTDNVLLVSSLDRSSEVKKCVEKLKKENKLEYL